MCTYYFKSTPLSPCYTHVKSRCVVFTLNPSPLSPCFTHVKSRCVLLIWNPPPFRLATHMSSLLSSKFQNHVTRVSEPWSPPVSEPRSSSFRTRLSFPSTGPVVTKHVPAMHQVSQFISISSREETMHLHQLWMRMKWWSEENLCWAAFGTRWRVACVECTRFIVSTCLLFVEFPP